MRAVRGRRQVAPSGGAAQTSSMKVSMKECSCGGRTVRRLSATVPATLVSFGASIAADERVTVRVRQRKVCGAGGGVSGAPLHAHRTRWADTGVSNHVKSGRPDGVSAGSSQPQWHVAAPPQQQQQTA